eukprot:6214522-Pleurochrysis_carterae.AAC.3
MRASRTSQPRRSIPELSQKQWEKTLGDYLPQHDTFPAMSERQVGMIPNMNMNDQALQVHSEQTPACAWLDLLTNAEPDDCSSASYSVC